MRVLRLPEADFNLELLQACRIFSFRQESSVKPAPMSMRDHEPLPRAQHSLRRASTPMWNQEPAPGSCENPCTVPDPMRGQDLLLFLDYMDSQWFAADDEGRTEQASEHKIRKAREEGKVAKSPDLTSAIVLLFSIITLTISGRSFFLTMGEMLRWFLIQSTQLDPVGNASAVRAFYEYFVRLLWPILTVTFIAAILGNLFQVGFLFTTKPLKPDLKRIAPNFVKYFKRVLFSSEALYNLAKSIAKVIVIGAIAYINIDGNLDRILNSLRLGVLQAMSLIAEVAFSIILQSTIVFLLLSLFDYLFQRRQHMESLKMSKQEVKEERKTYEGDPLVKNRLRQRMREVLSQNIHKEVPRADVVVTNPSHYAVALAYKVEAMRAPTVVAKGVDAVAQRIKQIAFEHDVPVIENRPLARALYSEVDLGDIIPENYYEAVVAVFKEIYRMNSRRKEVV